MLGCACVVPRQRRQRESLSLATGALSAVKVAGAAPSSAEMPQLLAKWPREAPAALLMLLLQACCSPLGGMLAT